MVIALDESILNITSALAENSMLEDSIIIFTTDSGAAVGGMELNSGSNFPLRGSKMTVWEGGIRGVAFVHSNKISEICKLIYLFIYLFTNENACMEKYIVWLAWTLLQPEYDFKLCTS